MRGEFANKIKESFFLLSLRVVCSVCKIKSKKETKGQKQREKYQLPVNMSLLCS